MKIYWVKTAGVLLVGMLALSARQAAAESDYGPKPLTAVPPVSAPQAAPADANAMPKELADLRQKMKDEFNAWMKDDDAIRKQCDAVHTPAERSACDAKVKASAARLDVVHAHTREMHRKIDTWRRKQAGLPPPEWWPDPRKNQRNGQTGAVPSYGSPPPPEESPVLLPSSPKPLPAGTF
jgi:hypothetical protein